MAISLSRSTAIFCFYQRCGCEFWAITFTCLRKFLLPSLSSYPSTMLGAARWGSCPVAFSVRMCSIWCPALRPASVRGVDVEKAGLSRLRKLPRHLASLILCRRSCNFLRPSVLNLWPTPPPTFCQGGVDVEKVDLESFEAPGGAWLYAFRVDCFDWS